MQKLRWKIEDFKLKCLLVMFFSVYIESFLLPYERSTEHYGKALAMIKILHFHTLIIYKKKRTFFYHFLLSYHRSYIFSVTFLCLRNCLSCIRVILLSNKASSSSTEKPNSHKPLTYCWLYGLYCIICEQCVCKCSGLCS